MPEANSSQIGITHSESCRLRQSNQPAYRSLLAYFTRQLAPSGAYVEEFPAKQL